MTVQRFLHGVDRISDWSGKLFAWLIVVLMLVVCWACYIRNANRNAMGHV